MRFWSLILLAFFVKFSYGKNLSNRYAIGTSLLDFKPFSPAFSLRFIPEEHYSGIFDFGLDSNPNSSHLTLGVRVLRYFILEENVNSFIGVGLYYLSTKEVAYEKGAILKAFIGQELFLPFFPNIAFEFETGFNCRSVSSTSISIAFSCGLHYYFY